MAVVRWRFIDVHNSTDLGMTEDERLNSLVTQVRNGSQTLNTIRATVDVIKYGNTIEHFEPLPVAANQDAPHLVSDPLLKERIRAIFNNRGVTIATTSNEAPPEYIFEINPNTGGSPLVQKNLNISSNVGPNRGAILQEGQNSAPELTFGGVILTQEHYEALETWFDKKILIELHDDLGRIFRGVFTRFAPDRQRRAYNPWYHQFQAGFTVMGYKNASGQIRYGRF